MDILKENLTFVHIAGESQIPIIDIKINKKGIQVTKAIISHDQIINIMKTGSLKGFSPPQMRKHSHQPM